MAEGEKRVTVVCAVPNGLSLRLSRPHNPDGFGDAKVMVPFGAAVFLPGPVEGTGANYAAISEPVRTEVDRGFITAWMEQNARNPLVVDKLIRLDEAEEQPQESDAGVGGHGRNKSRRHK